MKIFQIDCALDYDVQGATDFIFHIEAVRDEETQIILQESLDIEPALPSRRFTDRNSGNRYFRLHQSESGPLHVRYRAIVELAPQVVGSVLSTCVGVQEATAKSAPARSSSGKTSSSGDGQAASQTSNTANRRGERRWAIGCGHEQWPCRG